MELNCFSSSFLFAHAHYTHLCRSLPVTSYSDKDTRVIFVSDSKDRILSSVPVRSSPFATEEGVVAVPGVVAAPGVVAVVAVLGVMVVLGVEDMAEGGEAVGREVKVREGIRIVKSLIHPLLRNMSET